MKILLVQTSFLGDTILSTPIVAALKRIHPQAELWVMTTVLAGEIFKRDPLASGHLVFDKRGTDAGPAGLVRKARELRRHNFDCVYSLHRSFRTSLLLWLARIPLRIGFQDAKLPFLYHQRRSRRGGKHEVERNLLIVGAQAGEAELDGRLRLFAPSPEEVGPAVAGITGLPSPYAVLVPGSVWKTKRWDPAGYREVARFLIAHGWRVIVTGGPGEEQISRQVGEGLALIDLTGRLSIAETMYLIAHSGLVVCNDSMALHLASGFGIPTVAVFCSTSPSFGFGPWQNRAVVVEKTGLACKPCGRHGRRSCPTGTESCMLDVPAGRVIEAIRELTGL